MDYILQRYYMHYWKLLLVVVLVCGTQRHQDTEIHTTPLLLKLLYLMRLGTDNPVRLHRGEEVPLIDP